MEVSRRLVDVDDRHAAFRVVASIRLLAWRVLRLWAQRYALNTRKFTRLHARLPFWFVCASPAAQPRAQPAMELASRMKR